MNTLEICSSDTAYGVGLTDEPEGLSAIKHPGCAAAIWRRQPVNNFQSWIDTLEPEQLPKARMIVPFWNVREAASQICDICGTPNCHERNQLVDDTAALAEIFVGLMPASHLQLRFDVVTTNACRKFHIDAVTARLVCTYRGTGTQYGVSTDGAEPQQIFTVPTGAPILLRGTLWPEEPSSSLRHRSPPIEGTGETRLLLVLDQINDEEVQQRERYLH